MRAFCANPQDSENPIMKGEHRIKDGQKQRALVENAEEIRQILSEMVMSELGPIGKALITQAKNGDVIAARELFDRAFGKSSQTSKIDLVGERLQIPLDDMTDEALSVMAFGDKKEVVIKN